MRNIKISTKLLAMIIGLLSAYAITMYFQVKESADAIYNERYEMLRTQVEMAREVLVTYQSEEAAGTMTHEEAFAAAAKAISHMTYKPSGYVFAYDYDGTRKIMTGDKGIGNNYLDLTDKKGNRLIENLIVTARNGGGLSDYYWPKPGGAEDVVYLKTSYSLAFDPWNLMIGTGVYMDDVQAAVWEATRDAIIISTLVALGSILAALAVIRSISKPLADVQSALTSIADGDTSVDIPYRDLDTEIGEMANAVEVLKERTIERLDILAKEKEQQTILASEREERSRLQKEQAESQAFAVSRIADVLDALAQGDLTVRCPDLGTQYTTLRASFNATLEKLESALITVNQKGAEISASKDTIVHASAALATRTEHQAANLEEASAAIEELSVTVRQTADGARDAAAKVSAISSEAARSDEVVVKAIEAMNGIEHSSSEISKIIGVIDEIAFQTNLLALNAGVEAARAGDSGKGFAVVAQEVRELAQRSAAAAKEISDQISASSSQVSEGVSLVGNAGDALRRISAQIKEANDIVATIARSAEEQNSTLGSIAASVNELDVATQQNAAMAQDTTSSANILASGTNELVELIGNFRTSGTATSQRQAA